jgi:hypothetical protein
MQRTALEQRVARLGRAVGRAASEEASEARQVALEGLARFAAELARHFAEADARGDDAARSDARARLQGELAEIEQRARAAGDWPESWRAVSAAFACFARALVEYERAEELLTS